MKNRISFMKKTNCAKSLYIYDRTVADEVDPELLAKVLANPEMQALLNSLAKTMK